MQQSGHGALDALRTSGPRDAGLPVGSEHFVHVGDDDRPLVDSAASFLSAELKAGGVAVAFVAGDHAGALLRALELRGVDVAAEEAAGRFVLEDADETLAAISEHGAPDSARFDDVVGGVLHGAAARGRGAPVRVFGEMVRVLFERGETSTALALEDLWSALLERQAVSLFCAYRREQFETEEGRSAFLEVCRRHGHVLLREAPTRRSARY